MNMQKIGSFIQRKRKEFNMSQRTLGDYLSVTDKAVSKWERGLTCPDIDNIKNMSLLFNCSMSDIISGENLDARNSSNLAMNITPHTLPSDDFSCDVKVDFDFNSTTSISPFLFGDNLEHTRDCVNSGISAELLKNRKFVGKPGRYVCALSWYQIGEKPYLTLGSSYTKHFEGYKMKRMHECNSQVITNFTEGAVCGMGQRGLCVKAGVEYDVCIVAKAFSNITLTVQITDANGNICAKSTVLIDSADFMEYKLTLTPDASHKNANFEIYFTDCSTLSIGAISLMPSDNYRGMRRDVIEKMKEIGIKNTSLAGRQLCR